MNIIIAGAGGVGFRLAQTLSDQHSVVVIDNKEEVISRIDEVMDVLAICGDIKSPSTYSGLEKQVFDFFIAVTDSDDINLVSLLIASEFINIKSKVIRFKNNFFYDSEIIEKLDIQYPIFPFYDTAKNVELLSEFPRVNNIKAFNKTDKKLASIVIKESINVSSIETENIKVVGIERGEEFFIPKEEFEIEPNDLVYLFGEDESIKLFNASINLDMPEKITKIAIFGANTQGIEIAKLLSKNNINIKLIDKNIKKCQQASKQLDDKIEVINSKYNEHNIFKDSGLKNADMIIISSPGDEENITKSLEAKEYGVKKVIAINNDIGLYPLIHSLGIASIRGPKTSAYYSILEIVKSNHIATNRKYCGGDGITFTRKIQIDSEIIGNNISTIQTEGIRPFIIRSDYFLDAANDSVVIEAGDIIIVFGTPEYEEDIYKWISHL